MDDVSRTCTYLTRLKVEAHPNFSPHFTVDGTHESNKLPNRYYVAIVRNDPLLTANDTVPIHVHRQTRSLVFSVISEAELC